MEIHMLDKLPPRERQIVDLLYRHGRMSVAEICSALPDQLSGSAVRAMLKRLEDKGFVLREESEQGYLFSPTLAEDKVGGNALIHIVRTFFNGSPASAASALLGMSEQIKSEELDQLEALIARARRERQ
jgi:predicted transcriptional regulator